MQNCGLYYSGCILHLLSNIAGHHDIPWLEHRKSTCCALCT